MLAKQALFQKPPKLGNTKQALWASGGRHTSLLTQGGKREIEIPRKASTSHILVRSTLESLCKMYKYVSTRKLLYGRGARFSGDFDLPFSTLGQERGVAPPRSPKCLLCSDQMAP
jgi:hypothetical protein